MTQEELKKICNTYKESIIKKDTDRYLMLMAMDIERQTRHECVSMAYDLANKIANMHKGG
jgi:hypothetical protein